VSKTEILAELPKLKTKELAEIQARIEELAAYGPDGWLVDDELTDGDKAALDSALSEYKKNPEAGSPWREVEGRIRTKLRR
jgi:hypothetical protein